ncbi:uncharacterized protein [Parasteatoda tepidariorum]|uniref:uncharacterized protein n=1 Tax=Parasteatoda tepidariorum TaxID=114398 RepID=UPI0039BD58AD
MSVKLNDQCERGKHHESICLKSDLNDKEEEKEPKPLEVSQNSSSKFGSNIVLQTVNAIAEGPQNHCFVRCLIDGGSQISVITKELSRKLNLKVKGEKEMQIHTFGENHPKKYKNKIVELTLRNINDPEKSITFDFIEVTSANIKMPSNQIKNKLKSLGITLLEPKWSDSRFMGENVSILFGADILWSISNDRIKRINYSAVALETIFGWCVQGKFPSSDCNELTNVMTNLTLEENISINESLKMSWETESIGIKNICEEKETEKALELFSSSITQKEKRYEIKYRGRRKK